MDPADPLAVYHQRFRQAQAQPVTVVSGNGAQDLRGLHASRPAATAVPAGSTYWSVNEPSAPGTVYVSNGSTWSTLVVL